MDDDVAVCRGTLRDDITQDAHGFAGMATVSECLFSSRAAFKCKHLEVRAVHAKFGGKKAGKGDLLTVEDGEAARVLPQATWSP